VGFGDEPDGHQYQQQHKEPSVDGENTACPRKTEAALSCAAAEPKGEPVRLWLQLLLLCNVILGLAALSSGLIASCITQ
jgi:hypothetical protein